ncbi:unnamed protein product [Debaryomyces tyrocola]|nr:unnamed protein product [Debaryomyces tyrocola]
MRGPVIWKFWIRPG